MKEADIIRWLEEKAADSGLQNVRLTVENAANMPCSVWLNLDQPQEHVMAGFGNTFDEAFKRLSEKMTVSIKTKQKRAPGPAPIPEAEKVPPGEVLPE